MFDLTNFRLQDMTACAAALRQLGVGAASIEEAADRLVRYLYTNLTTQPDDTPACALVRLFKTHPYGRLSPDHQALVQAQMGSHTISPNMKCLTLLGSSGAVSGWNDPALSSRFRAIPLQDGDSLRQLPMFAQLFAQFEIDLPFLNDAPSSLLLNQDETTFNAFYLPQALDSPYVPEQENFVVPFGIQSILGFGGLLPTRELFAAILFSRVFVPRETAELFQAFALASKLSLTPFEHDRLTCPTPRHPLPATQPDDTDEVTRLRDRVATLEAMLTVEEQAVDLQSARLESSLSNLCRQTNELHAQSRRFESLAAASPVGIFQTDADGICLYTNTTWQQITGLSYEETLGEGWARAITPEDRPRVLAAWAEANQRGENCDVEFRVTRPDATIRWVHGRAQAMRDEAGQISGYVGTTEDITQRKRSETEQMKLMSVLEASLNELYLFRTDTLRFTYVNRGARLNLGYSLAALQNLTPLDIKPEMTESSFRDLIHPLTTGEQPQLVFETIHRRHDGSTYPVEVHLQLVDHEGERTFLAVIYDLTRRKESERQLHQSRALLSSIFTHLPNMVFVKDAKTLRFVEFNHAGETLTGFRREDLLGKSDYDFFPKQEADFFTERDRAVLESGALIEIPEETIHTRYKGVRILQTKKIPLSDVHGEPQYLLGISEDITERKAAEAQFKQVFESTYTGMLMVGEDGKITLANPQIEHIFGYDRAELIGQPVEWLLPERYRTSHKSQRMAFMASGASRPMAKGRELYGRRRDGTELPLEIGLTPVDTPQGRQILASITDISDRRRAEEERVRLQYSIDHASEGVALLDSEGRHTYVNRACAAMFGYKPDELLERSWRELYPPEWVHLIEQLYWPALHENRHWEGELVGIKQSGETFHVEVMLSLVNMAADKRDTLVCTCRDISRRKQMEHELIAAKDAAEAGARVKVEFLATMSHEIRTPMNGVIGMTGLLLDTPLTAEQREYVETLRGSGESLLAIINDILDFSKIEAGKLDLEPIPFDLRATLDQVLELLAHSAQRKRLELSGLVNADVPSMIIGDPGRLKQILINLVGNGIKFTERGDVSIHVSAKSVTATHVLLHVDVIDTGIGISPAGVSKLFASFSQADTFTSRKYGGTGLGLAICKRLVELMGGTIGVDSAPGHGSRFWFDVQLGRADSVSPMERPSTELRGKRLCIVDDHTMSQRVLEHYAAKWNMEAQSVATAADVLPRLRSAAAAGQPVDLAILNMQLPDMSGLDLAKQIKADSTLGGTHLILLTALGQRGDAKAAEEAGVAAYLTKPIREHQFAECVRMVLGRQAASIVPHALITRHTLSESQAQSRPHILVADDNPVNQKVAVKMLEKLGHRADVACNGKEALAALARHRYALVFMDCQMPDMDGFQATAFIRRHTKDEQRLPIIAMTANAMKGDREHCLAAGMDDFICKPVMREELERVLTRWLKNPLPSRGHAA